MWLVILNINSLLDNRFQCDAGIFMGSYNISVQISNRQKLWFELICMQQLFIFSNLYFSVYFSYLENNNDRYCHYFRALLTLSVINMLTVKRGVVRNSRRRRRTRRNEVCPSVWMIPSSVLVTQHWSLNQRLRY